MTPRGFDIVSVVSTRHQWFPCGPLLASHLTWFFPGLFRLRSRPWLLSTAARGGLEPAPVSRFRGAVPHRLSSYTHWALLGPLRSWRTIIATPGARRHNRRHSRHRRSPPESTAVRKCAAGWLRRSPSA